MNRILILDYIFSSLEKEKNAVVSYKGWKGNHSTAFRHPVSAANSLMTQNEEAGSVASSRIIGSCQTQVNCWAGLTHRVRLLEEDTDLQVQRRGYSSTLIARSLKQLCRSLPFLAHRPWTQEVLQDWMHTSRGGRARLSSAMRTRGDSCRSLIPPLSCV